MTSAEIKKAMTEAVMAKEVEILEEGDLTMSVYDIVDGREIHYTGDEAIDEQWLAQRISIPQSVVNIFVPAAEIAKTLLGVLDKEYFNTLRGIVFFDSKKDFDEIKKYTDTEELYLSVNKEQFQNECVGLTIWSEQIVLINCKKIRELSSEEEAPDIRRGIWITVLHELRHLLLDCNPYLPMEKYPVEAAAEDAVEEWAINVYENLLVT